MKATNYRKATNSLQKTTNKTTKQTGTNMQNKTIRKF